MKFRKKPVIVEANQFILGKPWPHGVESIDAPDDDEVSLGFHVESVQGWVKVNRGDWIITEPDGVRHYPCAPDIFKASYEAVES